MSIKIKNTKLVQLKSTDNILLPGLLFEGKKKQEPEVQPYPSEHGFGEWKKP